jgi:hypothetical protein
LQHQTLNCGLDSRSSSRPINRDGIEQLHYTGARAGASQLTLSSDARMAFARARSTLTFDGLFFRSNIMRVLRWLLILPGAILFGMVGSLAGGIVATFFGQTAMDSSSAFFGPFAFICGARVIAPSHKRKVMLCAAGLVALLAISNFVLAEFTTAESFAHLTTTQRVLTPLAQFLASLYAIFILPPLLTSSTLERLWLEIVALGTIVAEIGALLIAIGLVVGLLGRGWLGLMAGLGVLFLGAITWLFPYFHLKLRVRRMLRNFPPETFVKKYAPKNPDV